MKTLFKSALALVLVAVSVVSMPVAQAAQTSSNLTVSATVTSNCTISSGALSFGAYDPVAGNAATALDGSATLVVTCTAGSPAVVTLGQGANADQGSTDIFPMRRMKAGSDYLNYQLFTDSNHFNIWGNDPESGLGITGTGSSNAITVYGSVAAGQNVPTGTYTDTVVATVTF